MKEHCLIREHSRTPVRVSIREAFFKVLHLIWLEELQQTYLPLLAWIKTKNLAFSSPLIPKQNGSPFSFTLRFFLLTFILTQLACFLFCRQPPKYPPFAFYLTFCLLSIRDLISLSLFSLDFKVHSHPISLIFTIIDFKQLPF